MKPSFIFSSIICLAFLLSSCNQASPPNANSVSAKATEIIGIDISNYQGTVDFKKIKAAGISYVFVRATEEITYQDTNFKSNLVAARAAGLATGAYHILRD